MEKDATIVDGEKGARCFELFQYDIAAIRCVDDSEMIVFCIAIATKFDGRGRNRSLVW